MDLLASILSPHGFPRLSRSIGKPLDPVSRFNDISGSITVNQPAVATTATAPVSARTAALLADISGNERPPRKRILAGFNKTLSTANEMKKSRNRFVKAVPRASSMNPTNASVPSKRPCPSSAEISMKQKEREDSMIYKAKEREDLKARKKVERDEKARQKRLAADLAEVNKLKTDKKLSTLEMIVDLPFSIENSSTGTQIREYLQNLQIQTTSYSGPVPNVISWRRKVAAIFNESLGHWERVPETIRTEKHVLCLLTAREFTAMLVSDPANSDGVDVETHVMKMKSVFPGYTLIYIIEGLDVWLKKHKSMRNRAYQAAALNPAEDEVRHLHCGDHVSNPSQKNVVEALVDEDVVEDALLWLQVAHKCLVQQSAMTVETAEWIASFTQHISTIPYRYSSESRPASRTLYVLTLETGGRGRTSKCPSVWMLVRLRVERTKRIPISRCFKKLSESPHQLLMASQLGILQRLAYWGQ